MLSTEEKKKIQDCLRSDDFTNEFNIDELDNYEQEKRIPLYGIMYIILSNNSNKIDYELIIRDQDNKKLMNDSDADLKAYQAKIKECLRILENAGLAPG